MSCDKREKQILLCICEKLEKVANMRKRGKLAEIIECFANSNEKILIIRTDRPKTIKAVRGYIRCRNYRIKISKKKDIIILVKM